MAGLETTSIQWIPVRTITLDAASYSASYRDHEHVLDLGSAHMLAIQARIWAQVLGDVAVTDLTLFFEHAADLSDSQFSAALTLDVRPASSFVACPYTAQGFVPASPTDLPPLRFWRHGLRMATAGATLVTLSYEVFARVAG